MNVLEKIKEYKDEIEQILKKASEKRDELIEWSKKNRKNIEDLYPTKGKIYEVIDIVKSFNDINRDSTKTSFFYRQKRYDKNKKYFFKVTSAKFSPYEDFYLHGLRLPTVEGILLDDQHNPITRENDYDIIQIDQLKSIDELKSKNDKTNKLTFIYLMIDKNTGYYKIGKSVNPKYREKTLQSEKPTIEMLLIRQGKSSDEKALHETFKEKRIRGEWFDLSSSDLTIIHSYFNNKKDVTSITSCNF